MFNEEFVTINSELIIKVYKEIFEKRSQDYDISRSIITEMMQSCLRYSNEEICSVNTLKCRYNYMIDYIKKNVIDLLSKYDADCLRIIFYNLAEYMAESHLHLYEKIYSLYGKAYWKYQMADEDLKDIWLVNKINIGNVDWFSTLMGADKAFIQYIFIFLDELGCLEVKSNFADRIIVNDFYGVYELVAGIASLVEERDFLQLVFDQVQIVKVVDGIIIMPDILKVKCESYKRNSLISSIKTDHSFSGAQYKKMDCRFHQDYGFTTVDLELLFTQFIGEKEITGSFITIMPKSEFQFYIGKVVSQAKANCIIEYLLLKSNGKSDIVNSLSQYDYRLLRKPLVELSWEHERFIMFSPFLFYYTLSLLTKEIRYGQTKGVSQRPLKKINNEIVERLEIELKKRGLHCLSNYDMKDKEGGKNYEVDLLFIKNNDLYVVECKDIKPKFTASETKNDMRRIRKEYIPNIDLKRNIISNNAEEIKCRIEGGFKSIKKILVFKNYTFAKELIENILMENNVLLLTEAELIEIIRK